VVCQLRFPRILKINEKQPADFQERIRDKYPLYQVTVEQQQQITLKIGAAEMPPTPHILQSEATNNYNFSSVDRKGSKVAYKPDVDFSCVVYFTL